MNSNSEPKRAIYTDDAGKKWVCMGWGSVQMGVSKQDDGSVVVWLQDVLRQNRVGLDTAPWEVNGGGESVLIGFNGTASLDVLERTLRDARALLEAK